MSVREEEERERAWFLSRLRARARALHPIPHLIPLSLSFSFSGSDGYAKRFGLLHVDYETQARSVKASAAWLARRFRGTAAGGGVVGVGVS